MTPKNKNHLTILVIFAMTIVPFLIALSLKENPHLLGKNQTNYGRLINPVIPTERTDLLGFDDFSKNNIAELAGHWLIVNVITDQHCSELCLDALLKTKQLRVMLNKELMRTRRVALLFENADPELAKQWWLKDSLMWRLQQAGYEGNRNNRENTELYQRLLQEQNQLDDALIKQLIGNDNREYALNSDLIRVKPNESMRNKIMTVTKGKVTDGMLFLMDPLGNLMMHYESGFDPYKVKNDLMHLLKTSQVG